MITPEQFQEIGETLLPLLDDLTEWIARDMIERFMIRFGRGKEKLLTGTDEWQAWVLEQAGGNLDEIQKVLAKQAGKSQEEIAKIFKESGIQAAKADADAAMMVFTGHPIGCVRSHAWRNIQHHAHNCGGNESEIYRYLRHGLLESAHGRAILFCGVDGWDQSNRRSPADCAVSIRA